MHELLTLIYFEFKKIFKRKSTGISLVILFILTFAIVLGMTDIKHPDFIQKDREYQKALSGRVIDTELMLETQEAYSHINPDDDQYYYSEEWETYARPYNHVFLLLQGVYFSGENRRNNIKQFLDLSEEDFNAFYTLRDARLLSGLNNSYLTEKEIKTHLKLKARLKTPITYEASGGYGSMEISSFYISLFVMFVTAVCLAPIFAGEYSSNTAQIILPTKCRNKEIFAKIMTGVLFSVFMSIFYLTVSLLLWCSIYGFEGAGVPYQLSDIFMTYPLTYLSYSIILILCSAAVNLLVAGITLLLSSRFHSPFGVIVLISIFIFESQSFRVLPNKRILYDMVNLLPGKMIDTNVIFGRYMFNLPGGPVLPYQFIPVFGITAALILLIPAFHSFKGHQVG